MHWRLARPHLGLNERDVRDPHVDEHLPRPRNRIRHVSSDQYPATKTVVAVIQEAQPRRTTGGGAPFACDGFINMALLETSDWIRPNLNHFGLLVRDAYGLMHRISEERPMRLDQRPQDRPFAEYRVWDPEGNAIDLSEKKGYKVDIGKIERIED